MHDTKWEPGWVDIERRKRAGCVWVLRSRTEYGGCARARGYIFGEVRCGVGDGSVEFALNLERMASPRVNAPPPSYWVAQARFPFPRPMSGDYFNRIVLWRNWTLRGSCGIGARSRGRCFVSASAGLRVNGEGNVWVFLYLTSWSSFLAGIGGDQLWRTELEWE
jgi:hypothetical protein